MVWARGEPAYLKYWLTAPTDRRSSLALQAEEGASLGLLNATIAAYLRRCGVESKNLRRLQSLSDDAQISEQCTLRRVKTLPDQGTKWEKGYEIWKPDACPGGSYENDCY